MNSAGEVDDHVADGHASGDDALRHLQADAIPTAGPLAALDRRRQHVEGLIGRQPVDGEDGIAGA